MINSTIEKLVVKHLDKDLADMTLTHNIDIDLALQLQIVRLLRGKQLNVIDTPSGEGWSADGKTWLTCEPGNIPLEELK